MSELDETDELILEAAERSFANHGFHETVVSDVADEAGVGKGTVYRRFGNKNDLFSTLVCEGSRDLIEQLRETVDVRNPLEERLDTIVDVHFDVFEDAGDIARIIVQEGLSNLGEWQEDVIETWEDYRALMTTFFEDDRARCQLRSEFAPEDCARYIGNTIWGTLRSTVVFDEGSPRNQYGAPLSAILLDGVTRREQ